MVKLTVVDDDTAADFVKNTSSSQNFDDSSSESDSEFEDDYDSESETILNRIAALKDIIPPSKRIQIINTFEAAQSLTSMALSKCGSLLWGITASSLLLGVPLSLAILSETQLQEMEKEMALQKSAKEVLAPGSESAYDEKSA